MRIIAGTAKGMKLAAPEGLGTRPVLDRVKESWFAVLGSRAEAAGVEGARVLDLYSGVGSLGLEALSRGAAGCVFVESDPECATLLDDHIERARLQDRAEVRRASVETALSDLARERERFDLVFLDPPFELARRDEFYAAGGVLERAGELLASGGLAMLRREAAGKEGAKVEGTEPAGLALADRRAWGRNEVLFFERRSSGETT
jgi:16S rRNA (guanine(966)-N(2))-methyltransferase RsmD